MSVLPLLYPNKHSEPLYLATQWVMDWCKWDTKWSITKHRSTNWRPQQTNLGDTIYKTQGSLLLTGVCPTTGSKACPGWQQRNHQIFVMVLCAGDILVISGFLVQRAINMNSVSMSLCHLYIDGLVQERHNSIANALELRLSCINPSI